MQRIIYININFVLCDFSYCAFVSPRSPGPKLNRSKGRKMMTHKNCTNREQSKSVVNASVSPHSFSIEEKIMLMQALDHLYVSQLYQDVGLCAVCRKISIKKCSSCATHYCSSECQTFDWAKHKALCKGNMDNGSERSNFSYRRQMRTSSPVGTYNNKDVFCKERLLLSSRNSPFASLANQLSKESANKFSGSKSLANFKFTNKQNKNKSNQGGGSHNGFKKSIQNHEPKKISIPKILTNHESSSETKETIDTTLPVPTKNADTTVEISDTKDENWDSTLVKSAEKVKVLPKQASLSLPKIWKKNVIGMYRESPERYWVMDVNNIVKFEEIQVTLAEECEEYESVVPTIGLVCGCKFSGDWFRARVLSLTPELTVHFIDYGNISVYEFDHVKQLPDKLKSIPPLVYLIQFDESTSCSFKTNDLDSLQFTIEETKRTVDGICCVRIISGPTGAVSKITRNISPLSDPPSNESSVMDTLTKTSKGLLFFFPGKGSIRYGSIVPEENKDANDCIEKVLNIKKPDSTPIEAKNGDYVIVTDKDGNDQRGKVLSRLKDSYYVQLIDCGNIITTDAVYTLSDDLKDLIELGVKMKVVEGKLDMVESCFFSVIDEPEPGKWLSRLKSVNDEILGKVYLEKPIKDTTVKPNYFRPKSGSTVEITYFSPPNNFHVRVIDAEIEQKFLEMNMEVSEFAATAKYFPIPPPPGEICCAKFIDDGVYYRVIVNSVKNNKISVLFVDFGNEQDTDIKDVKPLPETLKIIPFFAFQVNLKDVPQKPWNDSVVQYFTTLVTDSVELILTYDGSLSDGVILQEKDTGVVINKIIMDSQKEKKERPPSVKDNFKKSEIFLDDDMEYTTVAAGSTCSLAVLYINEVEFETNHSFWATVAGTENFEFVNSELSTLLSEYCGATTTPYEPSFRELCVAEFEGFWYRAMSVGKEKDDFKIFFLDFGNVCNLKSSSIRKMKKELMKAPALAMNCTINNGERLKGNPKLAKKVYEMLFERLNTVIKNVTVVSFDNDTFSLNIPEIEAVLSG